MAHSKSALKRWRQNERHRERNKGVRSEARTAVKSAREAIATTPDTATTTVASATSVLDRAAKRRIIHPNAASRHKSRLMRHLDQAGNVTAEAAPKRAKRASTKTATKKTAAKRTTKKS